MYQAVYKCRLCGEEFCEDTGIIPDKIIGIDFERKIIIDKNMGIHDVSIQNCHGCKDGSFGFVDFKGFRKTEE